MERPFQAFLIYRLPKVIDGSSRLYTAAGSLISKKAMVALFSLLVLALPLSAFAQSFTVTTNKDIYTIDEKAIIVGAIPENAPDGYAVLIKVTGSAGDCASQHLLPAADNSFMSRPIAIDGCGFGPVIVSASYAEEKVTSAFIISNSSGVNAGNELELRTLKGVILQAQEAANSRVKELVENNYILPEEVARKYGEGVSEASLALQAIEFGDAVEAKRHSIFALRDFREVLEALSEENVARFEQTAEQRAADSDNSGVVGTFNVLQRYYYRLAELAEKNGADLQSDFEAAARLLSEARQMIDEDDFESASLDLEQASMLLDEIRAKLVDDEEGDQKLVSYDNSTNPQDEESARRLIEAADRFERTALRLLNETDSAEAEAKLQEAISLIANARVSIEAQELDSAREALKAAYQAIEEAKELAQDYDKTSTAGNDDDDSKENSGKGNSNKGSNKGKNDQ